MAACNRNANTKLTIYSHTGHVVQRHEAGVGHIVLPKSAEVSSIIIVDSKGKIIPFSYVAPIDLNTALSEQNKNDVVVSKRDIVVKGKILQWSGNEVSVLSKGTLQVVRDYDCIKSVFDEDSLLSHVMLPKTSNPVDISYLLPSVSWKCNGTILIEEESSIINLNLSGKITNDTETEYKADVSLVSGDIYQYRNKQTYAPRAMLQAAAPMQDDAPPTSNPEDYTSYDVGTHVIKPNSIVIAELGTTKIKGLKLYSFRTGADAVKFGYRFKAPGFLPACDVNVYNTAPNASSIIGPYLGSNHIDEKQKGDIVDLMLGDSTRVQCKSTVESSSIVITDKETADKYGLTFQDSDNSEKAQTEAKWRLVTDNIKVDISNRNEKDITLIIKHYVGDRKLVNISCQQFEKREDGFLEWYFNVPATVDELITRQEFVCKVVTADYY